MKTPRLAGGAGDALKVPTNIILEIRIEDRASRLFYHQKQQQQIQEEGDSAPEQQEQQQPILPMFNIRNRAIVEILVVEGEATRRSKQKPKVKRFWRTVNWSKIWSVLSTLPEFILCHHRCYCANKWGGGSFHEINPQILGGI